MCTLAHLAEQQWGWPCSREHWFQLPEKWCPWWLLGFQEWSWLWSPTQKRAGNITIFPCLLRCANVPACVSPSRPWGRRTELSKAWRSGRWAGTSAPTAAGCSWGWCSEAGCSRAKRAATSVAGTIHLHTQNMHKFPCRDHNRVSWRSKLFPWQPWLFFN